MQSLEVGEVFSQSRLCRMFVWDGQSRSLAPSTLPQTRRKSSKFGKNFLRPDCPKWPRSPNINSPSYYLIIGHAESAQFQRTRRKWGPACRLLSLPNPRWTYLNDIVRVVKQNSHGIGNLLCSYEIINMIQSCRLNLFTRKNVNILNKLHAIPTNHNRLSPI